MDSHSTEWSINQIARLAGTTSRTLRHYGELGLLPPTRVGGNGYRYYDSGALVRLQRILLLRQLGMGLPAVADALAAEGDAAGALEYHLRLLERERERLARQITAVRSTIDKLKSGEELMAEEVLGGFDHRQYEQEVTERWGREAWEKGQRWWGALTEEQRAAHQQTHLDLAADYGRAKARGLAADSPDVQAIAARHVAWIGAAKEPTRGYVIGLGEMYVADPRFGANYDQHGAGTAELVRDALRVYAERNL